MCQNLWIILCHTQIKVFHPFVRIISPPICNLSCFIFFDYENNNITLSGLGCTYCFFSDLWCNCSKVIIYMNIYPNSAILKIWRKKNLQKHLHVPSTCGDLFFLNWIGFKTQGVCNKVFCSKLFFKKCQKITPKKSLIWDSSLP